MEHRVEVSFSPFHFETEILQGRNKNKKYFTWVKISLIIPRLRYKNTSSTPMNIMISCDIIDIIQALGGSKLRLGVNYCFSLLWRLFLGE